MTMETMIANVSADRSLEKLRDEYESLGDLRLTLTQVARLLDVDQKLASHLLRQLEDQGLLFEAPEGVYRRSVPLLA
jgi:Mn-dependent DtxR family transcriptional regulator